MKPIRSTYRFESDAPLSLVWNIICDNAHSEWRSDLDHIEIRSSTNFIEYGKQGSIISFTITKKEPMHLYCFAMQHQKWDGTWSGEFYEEAGKSVVILKEEVQMHNPLLHFVASFFMPLKKMQAQYCNDLHQRILALQAELHSKE